MGRRGTYEAPDMAAMVIRVSKAMVRRAGEGDLETLSALASMLEAVKEAQGRAAVAAHGAGYSWAEIADELGISRQAAWRQFSGYDLEEAAS